MNRQQIHALKILREELVSSLDVDNVALQLYVNNILTAEDFERILAIPTEKERRKKFLEIISYRDNSWNTFLEALENSKQRFLAEKLQLNAGASYGRKISTDDGKIVNESDEKVIFKGSSGSGNTLTPQPKLIEFQFPSSSAGFSGGLGFSEGLRRRKNSDSSRYGLSYI